MLLRLLRVNLFIGFTMAIITLMAINVNCKPQDSNHLENIANKAKAIAGKVREKIENAGGKISERGGFGSHLTKGKSDSFAGNGAALRNDDDRIRRKRSYLDFQIKEDALIGEEYLLALPLPKQEHLHRGKRSPCNHGGGTGAGDTGAGIDDGDYTDLAERRRRAIARKRAAAKRRAEQNKNSRKSTNSRKKLVNDGDDDDTAKDVLTRRKRQTEIDDLNQNMAKTSNDFSQLSQQAADKIRNIWENFMNSVNEMAQRMKQYIIGQNSTDTDEI